MSFGFLHVNLIWWLRFCELPYVFARWSAINPVRKHDSVDWPTNCSNQAWAQSSSWANGIWMCLVECATQNDRGDAYWLYCVWVWTGWFGDAKCMHTPKYTKRAGWTNMSKSSPLFGSWAELGLLHDFPAEVRNVWDCLVSKRTCCFRQQLHTNHLLPSIPIVFEKTTHDENLPVFLWKIQHFWQSGNRYDEIWEELGKAPLSDLLQLATGSMKKTCCCCWLVLGLLQPAKDIILVSCLVSKKLSLADWHTVEFSRCCDGLSKTDDEIQKIFVCNGFEQRSTCGNGTSHSFIETGMH